ncbi:MAG: branched-chain amino acid ABC transporter permease [Caldiserica bacterium]|jgi:branched-chain amino acid transport system permease protein|nr:branched-chain amino acid ABC transporter permease [Caldisericota bacterium]MDH7563113.1 branched-chain amino acid ABC transporter permease [Caldisericota bacterium]
MKIPNFLKKSTVQFLLYSLIFYLVIFLLNQWNVLSGYPLLIIEISLIYVILATSLNLINGFTGQFSIGHMGFAAVGAYVSGTLTTLIWKLSVDQPIYQTLPLFVIALLLGGVAAALIGFLIGLPTLRLRGDYLAIVTLGFGEIIRTIINNIDYVGGPRGLLGIPQLSNFTLICIFTFLTLYVLRGIIFSSHGRAFISVREDEVASELVGINTTKYKVLAFTIGAFFAGIAGGLLCHLIQIAHPTQFGFLPSFMVLVIVYLGGMGSLTGSVIAAFLLTILEKYLLPIGLQALSAWTQPTFGFQVGVEWRMVIYALLLIVMMLFRPEGIMGMKEARFMVPEEH